MQDDGSVRIGRFFTGFPIGLCCSFIPAGSPNVHNPAISMTEKGSDSLGDARTEIDIRTGTYKLDDKFSEEFFKTGVRGPETIVLFPDRKKMVPFHGREALADSQRYLDGCKA